MPARCGPDWGWWVRIEGQLVRIPGDKRVACNREVRDALLSLAGERAIPYTIHHTAETKSNVSKADVPHQHVNDS